jgi:hypothetical protein
MEHEVTVTLPTTAPTIQQAFLWYFFLQQSRKALLSLLDLLVFLVTCGQNLFFAFYLDLFLVRTVRQKVYDFHVCHDAIA